MLTLSGSKLLTFHWKGVSGQHKNYSESPSRKAPHLPIHHFLFLALNVDHTSSWFYKDGCPGQHYWRCPINGKVPYCNFLILLADRILCTREINKSTPISLSAVVTERTIFMSLRFPLRRTHPPAHVRSGNGSGLHGYAHRHVTALERDLLRPMHNVDAINQGSSPALPLPCCNF